MKYTKEDIEKMKSDPWMRLLCMLAGKDFDELLKEVESEESDEPCSYEGKRTVPEIKPTVNLVSATKPFPLGKDEYAFLVKCAVALNDNIAIAKRLGFSDINTKDLTLVGAPLAMIYTLLRTLVNPDFAGRFMAGIPNEGSDYFYKLYDDQTRIY